MNRRAIRACAGTVALLAATSVVGYFVANFAPGPEAPRAPLPLSRAARACASPLDRIARTAVVPAALVEAAVPPTVKPKSVVKAKPSQPQSGGTPTPVPGGALQESEARLVTDGITAALPPSLVPRRSETNLVMRPLATKPPVVQPLAMKPLVMKPKTPFVTPEITPALPPAAPLVAPAPQTAGKESNHRDNKLRIGVKDPKQEPAPAPVVAKPAAPSESLADDASSKKSDSDKDQAAMPNTAADDKKAAEEVAQDVAVNGAPIGDKSPAAPEMMPLAKDSSGEPDSAAPFGKLPFVQAARRSPEVVATIKRADGRVRHGFQLAQRGALYAARAEFIAAIQMIAQGYDAQEGSRQYSKAAAAGMTALKEAGDFVRQSHSLRDADLARLILPHTTPVLKDADTTDLAPIAAAQSYYTYAQEQLSAATAQEMCGSMALYAMGKVAIIAAKSEGQQLDGTGQAIALYRAALIAEPKNYRAANELGVLLAENGQLELARDLLIRSVSVSPQATTWRNLAVVHSRSGQRNLAEHAQGQAAALQRAGREMSNVPAVQWVDPATFASTASSGDRTPPAPAPSAKEPTPAKSQAAPEQPAENIAKKSITDWLRLTPRR